MGFKLRRLHRQIGVLLALFVIVLCVTGIMLNHTDSLELDNKTVSNRLLLKLYGIKAEPIRTYKTEHHYLSSDGEQLYFNDAVIANCDQLQGAVELAEQVIAACSKQLLLLTKNGQLVETIDEFSGLPVPVAKIGLDSGFLIIKTGDSVGDNQYRVDTEQLEFIPHNSVKPEFSELTELPAPIAAAIDQQRSFGLTLERVVQDLHSGRIFGISGVLIGDIIAILVLFMTFSGLYIWSKRR